jgi:hypothetical protein
MISLLFKFFGDSTPLRQEAEKAKKDMGKAGADIGKEFGSQIKGAIMGAIGVGAIASALKAQIAEIGKAAGTAAGTGGEIGTTLALQRAADATGMKPEEILAAAKRSPKEFEPFIKQFESGLGEKNLRNVVRGRDVASEFGGMFVDALMDGLIKSVNRIGGVFKSAIGYSIGDPKMMAEGTVATVTGIAPGVMEPSPTERFMGAVRSQAESDAAFNEMVDAVNRQIEETRKVREAVEKN